MYDLSMYVLFVLVYLHLYYDNMVDGLYL